MSTGLSTRRSWSCPGMANCCWPATKNEGIKTHIKRAETLFGSTAQIQRAAHQLRIATITKSTDSIDGDPLPDENYDQLRQISLKSGFRFWSKPGLYGWDKIDSGSEFLWQQLEPLLGPICDKSVLDLGSGYGYLSMKIMELNPARLVATDNCIAAVMACKQNLVKNVKVAHVVADDAAQSIEEQFDYVLCNPPFHVGFSTTPALHLKFLQQTARLLNQKVVAGLSSISSCRWKSSAGKRGLYQRKLPAIRATKYLGLKPSKKHRGFREQKPQTPDKLSDSNLSDTGCLCRIPSIL